MDNFQIHFNKYKPYGIFLVFWGGVCVFYKNISELSLIKSIGDFLMLDAPTIGGDIFFFLLGFCGLSIFIWYWANRALYVFTLESQWIFIILLLTAFLPFRFQLLPYQNWHYTPFEVVSLLSYADAVMLFIAGLTFRPRKKFVPQSETANLLVEDDLFPKVNDIFKRESYAKLISDVINKQESKNSFAIGIIGKWGSGKSVFMDQVKGRLEHCITIIFNPWLSKQSSGITENFFALIAQKVDEYDSDLSKKIKVYSDVMLDMEDSTLTKWIKLLGIHKYSTNPNLQEQRDRISIGIKKAKLKFAIFIDDLDRLNSEEILSILVLIRNSFNFPNTFFFVAYDQDYVLQILDEAKIKNPRQFLEKIFQFEVGLPGYPNDILRDQLMALLSEGKSESNKQELSQVFKRLEQAVPFSDLFQNLRECIRYANCINLLYSKKKHEVDLTDFIVLEIIKHKDPATHQLIKSTLMGSLRLDYLVPVNEDSRGGYIAFKPEKPLFFDYVQTSNLLDYLFNRQTGDAQKSLKVLGNAVRYFSDHLFGSISFIEFDCYKNDDSPDEFIDFIKVAMLEGKIPQITQVFLSVYDIAGRQSLYNFCKGLFFLSNSTQDKQLAIHCYDVLVRNSDSKMFTPPGEFDDFLVELLKPEALPCSEIIVAEQYFRNEDFSGYLEDRVKMRLATIFVDFVTREISNAKSYNHTWIELHTFIPIIYLKENPEFQKLIYDHIKSFKIDFVKSVICKNDAELYKLDKYIDDLIGWDVFEEILYSVPEDLHVLHLKSFFKIYKRNNYDSIPHDFKKLFITSDRSTLTNAGLPAINTNRLSKLELSARHKIFSNSEWIAHVANITTTEAIEGGTYFFERTIDLSISDTKIKRAVFYFLVDDDLALKLNNEIIFESQLVLNREEPFEKEITNSLILGINKFEFVVKNIPYDRAVIERIPEANPYELIYTLVVDLDLSF